MSRKKVEQALHPLLITFRDVKQVDAVAINMLGRGYLFAMKETKESLGELAYRTKLAREIYGLPKGVGFGQQWRRGENPLVADLWDQIFPALRARLLRDLPAARLALHAKKMQQAQQRRLAKRNLPQ